MKNFPCTEIKVQKFVAITKSKVIPVQAMKANRGNRGRAPLILDQDTRW
jgi:hypothetical protein